MFLAIACLHAHLTLIEVASTYVGISKKLSLAHPLIKWAPLALAALVIAAQTSGVAA